VVRVRLDPVLVGLAALPAADQGLPDPGQRSAGDVGTPGADRHARLRQADQVATVVEQQFALPCGRRHFLAGDDQRPFGRDLGLRQSVGPASDAEAAAVDLATGLAADADVLRLQLALRLGDALGV